MALKLDRGIYEETLKEFYRLCGYDEKTGIPTRQTLERLGLENVAVDLKKKGLLAE
jgi:aldehyde:ferredoxin oxidoreductase